MVTKVIQVGDTEGIEKYLRDIGFDFKDEEPLIARKSGVTVTLFRTGKVMIQGKSIEEFVTGFTERFTKTGPPRIGTDEAGKGDYFGYLVVSGVFVDSGSEELLVKDGVRDSKLLSDTAVETLAKKIKRRCVHDIVGISPSRYNHLYSELSNLNILLAWAHARTIENMLEKVECNLVISDQFGNKRFLEDSLMEKGRKVRLIQRPKAEDDIAVACASILARAYYLKSLKGLSKEYDMKLPKGASNVVDVGKKLVGRYGREVLDKVAKVHFKTTKEIE